MLNSSLPKLVKNRPDWAWEWLAEGKAAWRARELLAEGKGRAAPVRLIAPGLIRRTFSLMPSKDSRNSENTKEAGLPWQDWMLLPLLSLLTICLILALTELIARKTFFAAGNMGAIV
jgi:hypothetical protein